MPLKLSPTQIAFNAGADGKFNQTFQEQVDFLKQKLNLPTEHWDDILKAAHDRAFVVAGAAKADLLADLHNAVNKAEQEGKGIKWFKENFEAIVQKNGWEGWTGSDTLRGRDWRARVIYNTNLRASYAAGRYAQMKDPTILKFRPYWKYIHHDHVVHPRPLHQAWGDKPVVLHHDDPWWNAHKPPNGFGCHCEVVPVRAKEYNGDAAPNDGTYTVEDRNGVKHTLPNGVDYGWDYDPGASVRQQLQPVIDNKAASLPKPLGEAFKADVGKNVINSSNNLTKAEKERILSPEVTKNNQLTEDKKMKTVTFYNSSRGYHQVLVDGIESQYEIFNGSSGLSGTGVNEYGIFNKETKKMTRIGSLQKAKKTVKSWIK